MRTVEDFYCCGRTFLVVDVVVPSQSITVVSIKGCMFLCYDMNVLLACLAKVTCNLVSISVKFCKCIMQIRFA
jgi:hypothetical protein